ncbi:transporter substrate-binding domain-containing protein [Afifella pfennigii]|uniref:transporter substrate-binding domain-containing protein n=1 Tax=Afifella pfennigii TaxID=209897 RepID=UPI00146FC3F3|nr:transporter substrate-binding domain-containing protein [Afifella pfennigii]
MSRILLALGCLALLVAGVARAQEPVIPNFWDPRSRIERPNADTIGPIRFLATNDFPPFSYRDRRGALIGFDIDLIRAVCDVLKTACAVQTRPFETLEKALRDKEGDAVIAGLAPDPEADEPLLATRPYLKVPARFVTLKETAFDPGAPAGEFVGTVCGSAHQAYLDRYFPDLNVACFQNMQAALNSLQEKRLKAVFGDALRLSFWLHGESSEACCHFAGGPYLSDRYFGDGLKIVVRPDEAELKNALDYALREVYRKGTYAELYLRYFPVSLF